MTFDDFWAKWPNKVGKQPARKAWDKLGPHDRADAEKCAVEWFTDWRKKNPQASHIHASTYLNQRRWEDDFEVKQKNIAKARDFYVDAIKSGKRFLCTNISAAKARDLVARNLVTESECRQVGVL